MIRIIKQGKSGVVLPSVLALILCVASLLAVAVFPARAEEAHDIFADVKPGKWYTEAVDWAYKNGFITEISDNVFDPNAPITREAFLVGLTKLNLRMTGTDNVFFRRRAR